MGNNKYYNCFNVIIFDLFNFITLSLNYLLLGYMHTIIVTIHMTHWHQRVVAKTINIIITILPSVYAQNIREE